MTTPEEKDRLQKKADKCSLYPDKFCGVLFENMDRDDLLNVIRILSDNLSDYEMGNVSEKQLEEVRQDNAEWTRKELAKFWAEQVDGA